MSAIQSVLNRSKDIQLLFSRLKGSKYMTKVNAFCSDYRDVFLDVLKQTKERPVRSAIYGGLIGSAVYCSKHNPSERDFIQQLRLHNIKMVLVSPNCQNPVSSQYLTFLERCYNEGIVRRLNVGVFSLLWLDNYDRAINLYKATCSYTKPELLTWHQRIIDVGFVGKWWKIDEKMIDYDVNTNES